MVDPSLFTPYYDLALVEALGRAKADASLITSEFLYDPELGRSSGAIRRLFFRALAWRPLQALCRDRPRLRQALKALEYPLDWLVVVAQLLRDRPQALHFQWVMHPPIDRWVIRGLRLVGRHCGFPILYTAHNLVPHAAKDRRIGRDLADVYRLADRILVHTEEMRRDIGAQLPEVADRIGLVGHGLLHEGYPPVPKARARASLGLPEGAQVVLFLGAISPYKGLATLLDAFKQVAATLPDALLLVVGKAEEEMAPYLAQIREAGLQDRVRLRLEFLPLEELPAYYGASDVVALPYRRISQSGALFTAFRFGVPVVTSDAPAFLEAFEDGEQGLRVPAEDPVALAGALVSILSNESLRARMRAGIDRLCRERYSWDTIAQDTLEHYRIAAARMDSTS